MEQAVKRGFARNERWGVSVVTGGRRPGRWAILGLAGCCWLLSLGKAAASPDGPMAIALSADGTRLYVAHMTIRSNRPVSTVSALDTATMQVVATFRPPQDPMLYSLAVSPDGSRLYLGEYGTVAILDPSGFSPLGTVKIGLWPEQMAVSPDGKRLYVAKSDPNLPTAKRTPQGGLAVVDTASAQVLTVLGVGRMNTFVTVSPDSRRIYVLGCDECPGDSPHPNLTLKVIDAETLQVGGIRKLDGPLDQAALSPDGTRLYMTFAALNGWVPTVNVYDTATLQVVGHATVGGGNNHVFADRLVVSPDGKHVYLTMVNSPETLRVMDVDTLYYTGKLSLPDRTRLLAISPDGKRLYSVGGPGEAVSVTAIDTATLQPAARVKLSPAVATQP